LLGRFGGEVNQSGIAEDNRVIGWKGKCASQRPTSRKRRFYADAIHRKGGYPFLMGNTLVRWASKGVHLGNAGMTRQPLGRAR